MAPPAWADSPVAVAPYWLQNRRCAAAAHTAGARPRSHRCRDRDRRLRAAHRSLRVRMSTPIQTAGSRRPFVANGLPLPPTSARPPPSHRPTASPGGATLATPAFARRSPVRRWPAGKPGSSLASAVRPCRQVCRRLARLRSTAVAAQRCQRGPRLPLSAAALVASQAPRPAVRQDAWLPPPPPAVVPGAWPFPPPPVVAPVVSLPPLAPAVGQASVQRPLLPAAARVSARQPPRPV